ncbi:HU family DNA-binding protein [Pectinatus cerevisiiphilus]|uniref:DNA-binding protein HU-beta n=1 Tax=Pectinatus cerevisiiphilus TaxID=86956 RepID=A0A4R3K627_9FIRM|nr:HU family DNA-binding protein [Pectinatus cerevisiiphilus]TCS78210.1 DNA-binding protein HU-beta [Pectinatus cerevisiiphilus]
MNKAELVTEVSQKMDTTKKDAEIALNAVLAAIEESLVKGDNVQLIGFGTFEVKARAARKGRNPQTGAEIKIPASKTATFKIGKKLKEKINTAKVKKTRKAKK